MSKKDDYEDGFEDELEFDEAILAIYFVEVKTYNLLRQLLIIY